MEYGILEQISMTFNSGNRVIQWVRNFIVSWFPTIIGGFAPFATFTIAHYGQSIKYYEFAVAGGLTYSALTVFKWVRSALKTKDSSQLEANFKAVGFVVLLESVMIMSVGDVIFLAYMALGVLVFINGIANGCNLMLESKEKKDVRELAEDMLVKQIRQDVFNEIEEEKNAKKVQRALRKRQKEREAKKEKAA